MDSEDKTARERKQRMRARREADGLAQVSGWVPAARRAYARDVLRAVAEGANSLPPDPELAEALDAARNDLTKAQAEIEAHEELLRSARDKEVQLQVERDEARAAEAEGLAKAQEATLEAMEATRAAQEERERAEEAAGRAERAEAVIRMTKTMPGIKGRLVRWLVGDVLPD